VPKALLVLEDGSVFHGDAIGASVRAHGEVVFCTAMTGYQEALTDPSFAEQVLVMTYPLQGNYGINEYDVESRRIQVRAFVVRENCDTPSHWRSKRTLHDYLAENGVPGIAGVDTRALTRRLRNAGVMMGTVTHDETAEQALARLRDLPRYGSTDLVPWVSTRQPYTYGERQPETAVPHEFAAARPQPRATVPLHQRRKIVVLDLGVKYNILRVLTRWGARRRRCRARRRRRTSWRCGRTACCCRRARATRRSSGTSSRRRAGLSARRR
jgi:carbamoyl-phosphate synthase small subunit